MRSRAASAVAVLALAAWGAPAATWAVPAFARQYGTSCQTCHVAYPRTTPFGEGFRRNGYRFPGGRDEDFRREENQKLGADAYKDVFPWAIWPGELPSSVPLSLIVGGSATVGPGTGTGATLAGLGTTVALNAATTLGSRVSAWVGLSMSASTNAPATLSAERIFLHFSVFDRPWVNVRAGLFEPGVFSFSGHRLPGAAPSILTSRVGDSTFALEPTHLGLEATGVIAGRVGWTVGWVEDSTTLDVPKDVYARASFKLGGMRLDGEPSDGELNLGDPAPWREWSLHAGAFGYVGQTIVGTPGIATQDDTFNLIGGDLNAQLRDANLIVAYAFARHRGPFLASPTTGLDVHQLMVQLDYVVFPWLVPIARFELRAERNGKTEQRIVAGLYAMIRANIRASVVVQLRNATGNFEFESLQAGLSAGL